MLLKTHADTGFMHESFHKDNATNLPENGLHGPILFLES
jgi:meiotically up-regulated gene 157 (Mug157) protein